ncbi:MAG: DUF2807 domain-containing protein [Muribaculaceae bacterium]|nr:DUF2807 domain-containing protein [Muribaculaceae bacterium]
MKKLLLFFAILISLSASAQKNTYRMSVGQFDRLSVVDNLEVVYHCHPDSTGYVVYEATDDIAPKMIFTNTKGWLKIQVGVDDIDTDTLPVLHVYSDYLTSISSNSTKRVTILSNASVPHFCAKLMGNGSIMAENIKTTELEGNLVTGNGVIYLSGSCDKALYKMVGTGSINADMMKANVVNCKIMGSGNIGCWPIDKLDVRGIGSTKIYYKGSPAIKKLGGGKLFPLTEEDREDTVVLTE